MDKDPAAIEFAHDLFPGDDRISYFHGSFTLLSTELDKHRLLGNVDGMLLDLGVSSPQLDDPRYGFSFRRDGELDMRMDKTSGVSAKEWINNAAQNEIESVIRQLGEERYARRIAKAITAARQTVPITRTVQLANVIADAVPTYEKNKHPATRTFQAIRIFINNELEELKEVLEQVQTILNPGGRLVVISFHSLEDRIVKRFMRTAAKGDIYPSDLPVKAGELSPWLKIIGRPIRSMDKEIKSNPRARSAVLRVAERIAA